MARWETLLCAVGLLLAGAGKTDAFYLPGKAPNSFNEGEKVCTCSLSSIPHTEVAATRTRGLVGERLLVILTWAAFG